MHQNETTRRAGVDRRQFVGWLTVVLGGALSPACSRMLLEGERSERPAFTRVPLTRSHRALIATACELILPRTETPGARDAGVPEFVETMLSEWYDAKEREAFIAGLEDLERRSLEAAGVPFVDAAPEIQVEILARLEEATTERVGAPLLLRRKSPETFFLALKELTLVGYCTSEVGATQALQWQVMPGRYDACAPLASLGRASAGW